MESIYTVREKLQAELHPIDLYAGTYTPGLATVFEDLVTELK